MTISAVTLVQSMPVMAAGMDKKLDKDFEYGWSEDHHRWEWRSQTSGGGATADYLDTVQYLDSDGDPQQSVVGAARIVHTLTGGSTYHYEFENTVVDQEWDDDYLVEITGLGGASLTMTGDGGNDWDYVGQVDGNTHTYHYEISWEILAPGITWPAAGGCPTGTIRNEIPPYYSLVVFDGSSTAVSTLYDAEGNEVAGGQTTYLLNCVAD